MTEIRPIREAEAEPFLDLLCGVFGLDIARARAIFYTEPMFDLNRKWALLEGSEIVSILTTTPLEFGWGRAYGIAGVATRPERQGEGHASRLLQRVFIESSHQGEEAALLFAKNPSLYQKNGFEPIDRVIRTPVLTGGDIKNAGSMEFPCVKLLYDTWADGHADRLRRDERRWRYWQWHYRLTSPFKDGYICFEPGVLREAIFTGGERLLPVPAGTEWFGTTSMADQFGIPVTGSPQIELYLMGLNVSGVPQMFMTDQF